MANDNNQNNFIFQSVSQMFENNDHADGNFAADIFVWKSSYLGK
jgi:hypothetical protein